MLTSASWVFINASFWGKNFTKRENLYIPFATINSMVLWSSKQKHKMKAMVLPLLVTQVTSKLLLGSFWNFGFQVCLGSCVSPPVSTWDQWLSLKVVDQVQTPLRAIPSGLLSNLVQHLFWFYQALLMCDPASRCTILAGSFLSLLTFQTILLF